MKRRIDFASAILLVIASMTATPGPARSAEPGPWPVEKAAAWSRAHPWLVGCNFAPSAAINQLEMWQADTFDPLTIDRELGWAESLGFNSVRVFLHHMLWEQDPPGFLARMEQFLTIADRHHIGVMFVLFDAVWDPFPRPGKQRDPKPGLHNSGWVQSPGARILADPRKHDSLKEYVAGVLTAFKADRRVHAWDLFNEPDNTNGSSYGRQEPPNKPERAMALLEKAFAWAREVAPSQPLTAGVWIGNLSDPDRLSPINRYMLTQSDVISFHNYRPLAELKKDVESLKRYRRPILCTEYMARPMGSTFDPILPYLKEEHIGAYNWGFVAGKTQTIYPWDSWKKPYTAEPPVWFHDIFRPDGTPYDAREVAFIQKVTGKAAPGE
jgi:Cellulase (glycosyl hydrolase family 5)